MAVKFSQFTTRTGTLDASTKVVGYDDIGGTKTNVEIELSEFFANIPVATTTTIGGVKLGAAGANVTIPSATVVSGRYYPLQVSTESGYEQRGYMNVPWENIALNNLTMSGARTYQMDIGNGQGFDLTFFNNFTGNTSKVIFNNSGGVQIAENLTIVKNLIIQGQAYTELHTGATIDGIDWDSGNVQEVTLPAGSSDFDPSNAKAGATYVSPFIGRLDDIGENGVQLIEDIKKVFNNYKNIKTKILSASIRSVEHFNAVAAIGSDVATVPVKIFKELHKHHLTDKGVDIFTADWKKSGMKI